MLAQIKQLQDQLLAKEEENYISIVTLKEENQKLSRQIKQQAPSQQAKPNNDREIAKLSIENELLKK